MATLYKREKPVCMEQKLELLQSNELHAEHGVKGAGAVPPRSIRIHPHNMDLGSFRVWIKMTRSWSTDI